MTARAVIVLVGPKGSGKSHVGALVERELGLRFLRVEPIFLAHQRSSALTGMALEAAGYAKVLAAVADELTHAPRVSLETTAASAAFPAFLDELRARYPVRLVSIQAPLARCRERVKSRDQSVHIPVSDERVDAINARAAAVELPWDLVVDNGGPAPAEAIVAAFRRLLAG